MLEEGSNGLAPFNAISPRSVVDAATRMRRRVWGSWRDLSSVRKREAHDAINPKGMRRRDNNESADRPRAHECLRHAASKPGVGAISTPSPSDRRYHGHLSSIILNVL